MISTIVWNNYHITYVSECGFDALQKFKDFFEKIQKNETGDWKLVGHHDVPETAGPEYTWIVSFAPEIEGGGIQSVVFKHAVKKKRWNIERAVRGLFARGSSLIRRIESARKKGFHVPMRIFLFAEKYNYGIVQERFLIAEHIDGIDLRPMWRDHKEKVWETVLSMHKYKLGWGGDPNMGNFLLVKDGTLRAIDLGFNRPSWIARGKDLYCLKWLYEISDGRFRFNVLAAKIQNKIKGRGPYGKNGALALKHRLEEDEALKKRHTPE